MNIDHFTSRFLGVLLSDSGDHVYSSMKFMTGGLTSYRTAKLLNYAASILEDHECYLEIGVFTGYTLMAAHYYNNKVCIGIDHFKSFGIDPEVVKNQCKKNVEYMSRSQNQGVLVLDSDFKDVTQQMIGRSIGVLFVDGGHSYAETKDQVDWGTPLLSDQAVLVFDDLCFEGVHQAVEEVMKRQGHELLFYAKPYYVGEGFYTDRDRILNTGLAIVGVRRT
jgi:predicted O-methyltransferase YrrM